MHIYPNTIQIEAETIPFRLEKKRGRGVGLKFRDHEPVLLIRTPEGTFTAQARAFVNSNQGWILRQYKKRQKYFGKRQDFLQQINQGMITILGDIYKLQFKAAPHRKIQILEDRIIISFKMDDNPHRQIPLIYGGLRALAKDYLVRRTRDLAAETGSDFQSIRIKDHKSKWGSCSGKRNINLNWHLIFLEPALIDYVIIHELMHLREMNHSIHFWKWVETFYPDYKSAEKNLRQYQWLIGILAA